MRYTIKELKVITDASKGIQKLADLEDIEEELNVDLVDFLNWCIKYKNDFINKTMSGILKLYKKAICIKTKEELL